MQKPAYFIPCFALLFTLCVQAEEVPFIELKGHTDAVQSVAYSADGKKIVTASHDHTARIWDAEAGKELQKLEANEGTFY